MPGDGPYTISMVSWNVRCENSHKDADNPGKLDFYDLNMNLSHQLLPINHIFESRCVALSLLDASKVPKYPAVQILLERDCPLLSWPWAQQKASKWRGSELNRLQDYCSLYMSRHRFVKSCRGRAESHLYDVTDWFKGCQCDDLCHLVGDCCDDVHKVAEIANEGDKSEPGNDMKTAHSVHRH